MTPQDQTPKKSVCPSDAPKKHVDIVEDQTQADELETKLDNFVNGLPIKATEIGWEAIREQQQEFLESIDHYANQRALEVIGEDRADHTDWCGEYEHASDRVVCSCGYWTENELRAEQRKRLNLTKETE